MNEAKKNPPPTEADGRLRRQDSAGSGVGAVAVGRSQRSSSSADICDARSTISKTKRVLLGCPGIFEASRSMRLSATTVLIWIGMTQDDPDGSIVNQE